MSKGGILSSLYETSYVKNVEYEGAFIKVEAVVDKKTYGAVRMYIAE